jgi:hypothetical protein
MTKAKAIKKKCLECSGSPKEVTLCHLFDCPLWPFRFGVSQKTKAYKERMKRAIANFAGELLELSAMDVDTSVFLTK